MYLQYPLHRAVRSLQKDSPTTIKTRLCVPHSARHTLYTHHPNAGSWQPGIPRYSLGNTRHPDGHKMTKYRKSDHHSSRHFSATTTTINTRLCVPRSTRHTLYTHRPNAWSWQQRISRYSHTEKSLDYEVSYLCYYYWSLVLVLRAIYLCHVNDS